MPKGTHDWNKFLIPDEIKTLLTATASTSSVDSAWCFTAGRRVAPLARHRHQLHGDGRAALRLTGAIMRNNFRCMPR
ncbi:MAG TPA: hypothetical protein VL133_02525 [Devosia sp.]|nr:hypothetical protein [Devosia sp.]